MASTVHVEEAVLVIPSEPTPTRVLPLSALDSQLFLRFTVEYLLVYTPRHGSNQAAITAGVRAALAKALVPYYPLAGRVRTKPDGSGLEVVCRAQGALFIGATSDQVVTDFERAPRYVTQWRKLLSLQVPDVLKGAPPLVVQLTWLRDGGATLGVGFSHALCDGIGSAEFLNSFAELATGELSRVVSPVWDRQLFDSRFTHCNRTKLLSHPEFTRVPDHCGFLNRFFNEKLTPTSLIFDKRFQNELKKLALSTSRPAESSYTCFEVLSAHVWRSWARSLNLPSNQILKLLFSVNIRNRVKPSLPSGYYGNAFVLGCAQANVKELTENGLGHAASLVKIAKERVDGDYVKSVVESVSQSKKCPDLVGVLIMSEWSRLGLEKVDFGLGRPVHVGPICSDKYCLILPVHDQTAAVKVMVALPASAAVEYEYLIKSPYNS
ncbi:alcohol acyltransferase 9-like [Tripterygium wilfordii]|uniref:alcohol acyltransferase 9-like n=1 Tax=Tripterygium wilfordii TaxID=458696 RepID=UPI0018F8069A|nr:alcohol acyltransferase 9-like [Tripterygium wilfordii]